MIVARGSPLYRDSPTPDRRPRQDRLPVGFFDANSLFLFIAFTLYADHDSFDFCSKLFFFVGAVEGISKSAAGLLDVITGCGSFSLEDSSRFF